METAKRISGGQFLKAWYAVAVAGLLVIGCSDEKEFTPPKGGTAFSSGQSPSVSTKPTTDPKAAPQKEERPLDLGAPPDTTAVPKMPGNNAEAAPPVELENGKDAPTEMPSAPTPAPRPSNWTPSKVSPGTLASIADRAMANLRDTQANIPILATYGDLKGRILCQLKLRNSNTYWAQYAEFVNGAPHAVFEVSNGAKKIRLGAQTGRVTMPASKKGAIPPSDKLADAWLTDMPNLVLSPWVAGKPIFGDLVSAFQKAGYQTQVETLTMKKPEHTFIQDRVTFTRPALLAAKYGEARTSIIFDHDRGLPVTIEVLTKPIKQGPVKILWRAAWRFHNPFPDKTFTNVQGKAS